MYLLVDVSCQSSSFTRQYRVYLSCMHVSITSRIGCVLSIVVLGVSQFSIKDMSHPEMCVQLIFLDSTVLTDRPRRISLFSLHGEQIFARSLEFQQPGKYHIISRPGLGSCSKPSRHVFNLRLFVPFASAAAVAAFVAMCSRDAPPACKILSVRQ